MPVFCEWDIIFLRTLIILILKLSLCLLYRGCSFIFELLPVSFFDFSQSLIILGFFSSLCFIISICLSVDVNYEYRIFFLQEEQCYRMCTRKDIELTCSVFSGSIFPLKFAFGHCYVLFSIMLIGVCNNFSVILGYWGGWEYRCSTSHPDGSQKFSDTQTILNPLRCALTLKRHDKHIKSVTRR